MKRISKPMLRKRLTIIFTAIFIVFLFIITRLIFVQLITTEDITEKATSLWLRDIPFEAERGNILDRHGHILTTNISAPSVVIVPKQIESKVETAKHLAEILQFPEEKALSYVEKNEAIVRIHPYGRKISQKQEEQLTTLQLPGVYLAKDTKRYYPDDNLLAHVLGFTGIDNQGLMGLELQYDEKLTGKQGQLSYYSDAKGNKITDTPNAYEAPQDGLHLQTTLDTNIQHIIERELDLAELTYRPDGAMAIAVDPKTGSVLAMASRPTFQPDYYTQVKREVYERNLPIWSTFEPGSTFKIITLAAALEEKVIDLKKDTFHDQGHIKVGGAKLRCWKAGGHGQQTLLEVVQNSCNPGFVHIGQKLGTKKLFAYINKFGFGKQTNIDLPGEGAGIIFNAKQVGPVELATTSFGQGISVTPLQQVMAVSAAVNGGYLYEPSIAKAWIDPSTKKVVETINPQLKDRVISGSTSKEIRQSLEAVVAKGTGRPAYVSGYRVGGKTGTAQKVGLDGRYLANDHIVSFIGMAPADDPQIVVYLAVDNPKGTIQFGGVVAAPIVGTIIDDSLRMMEVPLRNKGLAKEYMWPDVPKETVPNLIGLTKEEILEDLSTLQIETVGQGNYVIDQAPKAGSEVAIDAKIRIYLNDKFNRENE